MITEKLIKDGIKAGLVQFVVDPNMESGTVCKIGDNWFYFGGTTAEELSPAEFLAEVPLEHIIDEIFSALEYFRDSEPFLDEYAYYESVLTGYFWRN